MQDKINKSHVNTENNYDNLLFIAFILKSFNNLIKVI